MQKDKLIKKIKESANDIEIPASLIPENIKGTLFSESGRCRRRKKYYFAQCAAAVVLLAVCGYVYTVIRPAGNNGGWQEQTGQEQTGHVENTEGRQTQENQAGSIVHNDAGDYYVVADSYEQIAEVIKASIRIDMAEANKGLIMESGSEYQEMEMQTDSQNTMMQKKLSDLSGANHSETNLQMEGVDESDIVKTDGSYIYIVDEELIRILDIRNGELKQTGVIFVKEDGKSFTMKEMYVEGDRLFVIAQGNETSLKVPDTDSNSETAGHSESWQETAANDMECMKDSSEYFIDTYTSTTLYTYNISDRSQPVLLGKVTQDGVYKTSRKIGNLVYLFTNKSVNLPEETLDYAAVENWMPAVNGEKIAANSVYIPQKGSSGLIVSSINLVKPDNTVDKIMIVNDNVDIYVSTEALYIYNTEYSAKETITQLAKFSLKNGIIDAKGAVSVSGRVTDTFSINEYQGCLRLLTTSKNTVGQDKSNLYLYDEKLELTGVLNDIAPGESIFAARYMGDMVYFVTFKNTDPLFAADLSDTSNPKLLGELKITGFSEYLHFWGTDKLLGIGYEIDEKSQEREGVKLAMFDISDPLDMKVLNSYVLKGSDYTAAADLYAGGYKTVLADSDENLIGLTVVDYGNKDAETVYHLFQWSGDKFEILLSENLTGNMDNQNCRGLYAGDTFYVISPGRIVSFNRQDNYKKLKMMEY